MIPGLKNICINNQEVQEVQLNGVIIWKNTVNLTINLSTHCTAKVTINDNLTYLTSSTVLEIPCGSQVVVAISADKYYYIVQTNTDEITYEYSPILKDETISVTAEELLLNVYINPASHSSSVTINNKTYYPAINVVLKYVEPGIDGSYSNLWHTLTESSLNFGTSTGPWILNEIPWGTKFKFQAGAYSSSNMSISIYPQYKVTEDVQLDNGQYEDPSTQNDIEWTLTKPSSFYINYVPHYSILTLNVITNGLTKNKTYTLTVTSEAGTLHTSSYTHTLGGFLTKKINVPANIIDNIGHSSTVTISMDSYKLTRIIHQDTSVTFTPVGI